MVDFKQIILATTFACLGDFCVEVEIFCFSTEPKIFILSILWHLLTPWGDLWKEEFLLYGKVATFRKLCISVSMFGFCCHYKFFHLIVILHHIIWSIDCLSTCEHKSNFAIDWCRELWSNMQKLIEGTCFMHDQVKYCQSNMVIMFFNAKYCIRAHV